jgi:hypothetical protein
MSTKVAREEAGGGCVDLVVREYSTGTGSYSTLERVERVECAIIEMYQYGLVVKMR